MIDLTQRLAERVRSRNNASPIVVTRFDSYSDAVGAQSFCTEIQARPCVYRGGSSLQPWRLLARLGNRILRYVIETAGPAHAITTADDEPGWTRPYPTAAFA